MRFLTAAAIALVGVIALTGKTFAGEPITSWLPACECGNDEPMDNDILVLGHTQEFFVEDLDPRLQDLRDALQEKVAYDFITASSLKERTYPLQYDSEIGTFVKTTSVGSAPVFASAAN